LKIVKKKLETVEIINENAKFKEFILKITQINKNDFKEKIVE